VKGATRQALRDAAILFAAAVEVESSPDVGRAWDVLRKAAVRYTTNPRPEGRPRKAPVDLAGGEGGP
jgi:hypothetical protein